MANDDTDLDRLSSTMERQRRPPIQGEVVGQQAEDGSARGKSHEDRIKELEESREKASKPTREEIRPPLDAEEILRSAGFKVVPILDSEDPNAGWSQNPTIKTQYSDPRFASTVSTGPEIYEQFDLSKDIHKDKLNELKRRAAKTGAPQVDIIMERPDFSPNLGTYIVFVVYREVFYRSIVEIK